MAVETQIPQFASSARDFLTRQEKKLGAMASIGFLALLALGAMLFSGPILAIVNNFLTLAIGVVGKTLALGALAVVLVFAVMFALDPRTWTLLWHLQHGFTRWLSEQWMKKDPIGRLRAFADEYLELMYNRFIELQGVVEAQLNRIREDIDVQENGTEAGKEGLRLTQKMAKHLRDKHYDAGAQRWKNNQAYLEFKLLSQRSMMLETNLKDLRKHERLLSYAVQVLEKFANTFRFKIHATRQSADLLEMRYESAKAVHGALMAIQTAFGFGDMAQFDQMTRRYIEGEIAGYLGQSEAILKAIPELTSGEALKGEMAAEELMERLARWDELADEASQEAQRQSELLAGDPEQVLEVVKPRQLEPVGRYRGLLGPEKK